MLIYSTPECHFVEFYGEGILCASDTKMAFLLKSGKMMKIIQYLNK